MVDVGACSPPVEQGDIVLPRAPEANFKKTCKKLAVAFIHCGQEDSTGVSQGGKETFMQKELQTMPETRMARMTTTHYNSKNNSLSLIRSASSPAPASLSSR